MTPQLSKATIERIEKARYKCAGWVNPMLAYNEGATEEATRALVLVEALKVLVDANYHSLLECTAWMGIPEKKRTAFIKTYNENSKFIYEEALKTYEESK